MGIILLFSFALYSPWTIQSPLDSFGLQSPLDSIVRGVAKSRTQLSDCHSCTGSQSENIFCMISVLWKSWYLMVFVKLCILANFLFVLLVTERRMLKASTLAVDLPKSSFYSINYSLFYFETLLLSTYHLQDCFVFLVY